MMIDIVLETVRASVLLGIVAFLWHANSDRSETDRRGWRLILGGFALLLFGSVVDITDNFDGLSRFVIIGDTETEAFLEKFVGFLGGFIMLAIGLVRWIPNVRFIQRRLEERVEEQTRALRASEDRLEQSERLNSLGQLAGGVAHDFNNLLMVISGYVGRVRKNSQLSDTSQEALNHVLNAADRAAILTTQLLVFGRRQNLQTKVLAASDVLEETESLLRPLLGASVDLELTIGEGAAHVEVDGAQLSQALTNLAINARDAMPYGGKIAIAMDVVEAADTLLIQHPDMAPGCNVRIRVTDDGDGIDAETMTHIFEPFFTTKDQGKGTGLGLAMVYSLVQQFGGVIEVDSELGQGTSFTIYLPLVDKPATVIPQASREVLRGNGETILLAEDDDPIRALVRTTLEELGYKVLEASDGFEALEVESEYDEAIDLLLSDVIMPHLSGIDLSNAMRESRPEIKVVLMSGFPCRARAERVDLPAEIQLVQKPATPETLAHSVRSALERQPMHH